jgi:DNA-binding transcriptional MerR regulator
VSNYDNPLARQLFTTKEIQEMSNINERSQAGATEQILREQNQHLRGERDRLEEQLAEAVRIIRIFSSGLNSTYEQFEDAMKSSKLFLDQNANPTP